MAEEEKKGGEKIYRREEEKGGWGKGGGRRTGCELIWLTQLGEREKPLGAYLVNPIGGERELVGSLFS